MSMNPGAKGNASKREVDRGAFLKSEWIEFVKEGYVSEEKQAKAFARGWKNGTITGTVTRPYVHPKPARPAPRSSRVPPRVPSLPVQPEQQEALDRANNDTLTRAVKTRSSRPYFVGERNHWQLSPRATATCQNPTTLGELRARLNKANKLALKSKFSQSRAVRGCLDFTPRQEEDTAVKATVPIPDVSQRVASRTLIRAGSRASSARCLSTATAPPPSTMLSAVLRGGSRRPRAVPKKTFKAFAALLTRLDNKVGWELSSQRLYLKNAFRKHQAGTQDSQFVGAEAVTTVLVSMGCAGIVDPVVLAKPFAAMHDEQQVAFMELIETYLEWAQKQKTHGQPWTR